MIDAVRKTGTVGMTENVVRNPDPASHMTHGTADQMGRDRVARKNDTGAEHSGFAASGALQRFFIRSYIPEKGGGNG